MKRPSPTLTRPSGSIRKTGTLTVSRGEALFAANEFDKAITDYTEAIRIDARNVDAYVDRGDVWSALDEYDQAIADYTEAIRLDPGSVRAYVESRRRLGRQKRGDKAIADASEAIRLDPGASGAYLVRGDAWREKGEWVEIGRRLHRGDPARTQTWPKATRAGRCSGRAVRWDSERDGKRAVESATRACESDRVERANPSRDPRRRLRRDRRLSVRREMAGPRGRTRHRTADETDSDDARLKLYRQKKPYRLAPR